MFEWYSLQLTFIYWIFLILGGIGAYGFGRDLLNYKASSWHVRLHGYLWLISAIYIFLSQVLIFLYGSYRLLF